MKGLEQWIAFVFMFGNFHSVNTDDIKNSSFFRSDSLWLYDSNSARTRLLFPQFLRRIVGRRRRSRLVHI